MTNEKNELDSHEVETGDVMMLEGSVIPFILLVTSRDETPPSEYGDRIAVCWLEHPEKAGHSEWLWESSLKVKAAWRKLASAA